MQNCCGPEAIETTQQGQVPKSVSFQYPFTCNAFSLGSVPVGGALATDAAENTLSEAKIQGLITIEYAMSHEPACQRKKMESVGCPRNIPSLRCFLLELQAKGVRMIFMRFFKVISRRIKGGEMFNTLCRVLAIVIVASKYVLQPSSYWRGHFCIFCRLMFSSLAAFDLARRMGEHVGWLQAQ